MKTIKTLALFLGLSLGIASCSKEGQDSPVLVERQVEGASKHVGSKDSVLVSFTIGADTEQLRLAQSLNADGVPVSPFMEEKDVVIRFAVRRNYNGQRYVTYTDAVCKKVAGENKAIYKGGIRLPDIGYDTYPAGSRPSMEGHEIAGVLLGEANNGTKFVEEVDANTVRSIEQTELLTSESDVVRSKVPYILDWMPFPLTSDGVQQQKLTLHFKPVGNLLRLQFNNQFDDAKTLESIKVVSNAFVTQAKFDFTAEGSLRINPVSYASIVPTTASGSPMQTLTSEYRMEKTYSLATSLLVEGRKKSTWHYLWVMPLVYHPEGIRIDYFSLNTQIIGRASDGKDYNMLGICSPLSEGSNRLSVSFKIPTTVETAFKGGKIPLWYLAEYDVAPGGQSLTNTNIMPAPASGELISPQVFNVFGYFDVSEMRAINVPGYYVPESYEYTIIQPSQLYDGTARLHVDYAPLGLDPNRPHTGKTLNTYKEEVLFPGETNLTIVSSVFYATEEIDASGNRKYVTYALRFEECGQRDKLTAYRYSFNGSEIGGNGTRGRVTDPTNSSFEINSVFLGSGFTGDINTISIPSFWRNRSDIVTRIIPVLGTTDQGERVTRVILNGSWEINNEYYHSALGYRGAPNGRGPSLVRPIKNEFKTAQ